MSAKKLHCEQPHQPEPGDNECLSKRRPGKPDALQGYGTDNRAGRCLIADVLGNPRIEVGRHSHDFGMHAVRRDLVTGGKSCDAGPSSITVPTLQYPNGTGSSSSLRTASRVSNRPSVRTLSDIARPLSGCMRALLIRLATTVRLKRE